MSDIRNLRARAVARSLIPPALLALRRPRTRPIRFEEVAGSWGEEHVATSGYDTARILQKVAAATRDVVEGRAAFERDSVTFSELLVPWHLVAGLLRSAAVSGGHLHVIDVGGSLGSTYRQCRAALGDALDLRWDVVEQSHYVEVGRSEFETDELHFFAAIEEVPVCAAPPTLVLSSVLQYLPDPYRMLGDALARAGRHVLIDRTPLSAEPADRLTIQHAASDVSDASYPCWIFARERLTSSFEPEWRVTVDELGADGRHRTDRGLEFSFRYLSLERR